MITRSFGLVGAGRVGLAMTRHAIMQGFDFLWGVDPRLEELSGLDNEIVRRLHARVADIPDVPVDACVIAVGDEQIGIVTKELVTQGTLRTGTLVFHTSGVRTSAELLPLEDAGMLTGSIHPIQSFIASAGETPLRGIGCGIEGTDAFYARAVALARDFGWSALRIATDQKALYHAACVFAGNFPTVLAALSEELLRKSAVESPDRTLPFLLPMMEEVLSRLQHTAPRASLTGPASRGQSTVLLQHFEQLLGFDSLSAEVYRSLSLAAAKLAGVSPASLSHLRAALVESEGRKDM
ncbi:MAG: DUF2520 domain-containing protein [Bacteroidia bacterium]|nr:DUF2520 domain-containing protein [Bacteroidia bacterium]